MIGLWFRIDFGALDTVAHRFPFGRGKPAACGVVVADERRWIVDLRTRARRCQRCARGGSS